MIIFGTRGLTSTAGQGTFNCPTCEAQQPYKHKRVRRFFHVYWIPLIPLEGAAEYVECCTCKGTFLVKVLDYVPRPGGVRPEAEFHQAMRRAMIHMMMADGEINDGEVERIGAIYHRISGTSLSEDDLHREIDEAQRDHSGMLADLKQLRGCLNDHGKELAVKSAYLVAAADGLIQDEEQHLLERMASAIDMTPAHFRGVMFELEHAGQS